MDKYQTRGHAEGGRKGGREGGGRGDGDRASECGWAAASVARAPYVDGGVGVTLNNSCESSDENERTRD